jgi:hypothetical protein
MITFLLIFLITFIISIGIYVYGIREYDRYILKLSEKYSLEDIEKFINDDKQVIENNVLHGDMMETIMSHMELWEDVKKATLLKKDKKA